MPESFSNRYTFAGPAEVPSAQAVCDRVATALGSTLTVAESHPAGFHGAPRAYAKLVGEGVQLWLFWEADRPEMEAQIDEPMRRMLAVNAAMSALGGTPRNADTWWVERETRRRIRGVISWSTKALALVLAVSAVWTWGWWGLALVIVLAVAAKITWTIGLARAFARG
jgi:hypothetical protein